jgi:hypothetical protein
MSNGDFNYREWTFHSEDGRTLVYTCWFKEKDLENVKAALEIFVQQWRERSLPIVPDNSLSHSSLPPNT